MPHTPADGGLSQPLMGIIIGAAMLLLFLIIVIVVFFVIFRHRKRKPRHNAYLPAHAQYNSAASDDLRSSTLKSNRCSNGNMYNCVATSDVDCGGGRGGGGGVSSICCTSACNTSSIYGNIQDGSVHSRKCSRHHDHVTGVDSECSSRGDYAVPDIMQSALSGTYPHGPGTGLGSISAAIASKPLPQTPNQVPPLMYPGCHSNASAFGSSAPYHGGHMTTYLLPCSSPQSHMTPSQGHMTAPQGHTAAPYASRDLMMNAHAPAAAHERVPLRHSHTVPGSVMMTSRPTSRAGGSTLSSASLQGMSGNNVYAELDDYSLWANDLGVTEYAEESLEFVEKIGEGQFGEVRPARDPDTVRTHSVVVALI